MITQKLQECTARALQNEQVNRMIELRDQHSGTRISSITSKIIRRQNNAEFFRMIVRVGIDFDIREENETVREDILVDVSLVLNRRTRAETYTILNVTEIPEFED